MNIQWPFHGHARIPSGAEGRRSSEGLLALQGAIAAGARGRAELLLGGTQRANRL